MAAEWGPAEQWRAALPQHAVLSRLRERAPAAGARPPLIRDLLFGLDGDVLLWDGERGALHAIALRRLGGPDPAGLSRYQVRPGAEGGVRERYRAGCDRSR